MSQTYFSKLDPKEKESRLIQLANSKGQVTIWVKGSKTKSTFTAIEFDRNRSEILLDSKEHLFAKGTQLLCSFELRGMYFFSQVVLNRSLHDHAILEFNDILYKSEKRGSYRLLAFPLYEIYVEFDLGEAYEGGQVVDMRSRTNQTALFKSFLKLIENREDEKQHQKVKYRIQDLSASGLSLHIGEMEAQLFSKDFVFKEVAIQFRDETIMIPEVKVVYVVDYISNDKNLKKFKVGMHFQNLPTTIDDQIGRKINSLLREIDFNKDFENFTK